VSKRNRLRPRAVVAVLFCQTVPPGARGSSPRTVPNETAAAASPAIHPCFVMMRSPFADGFIAF
jgi:hypothetical protein